MNPEIEEKLLTLQRYQEKQAKGDPFEPMSYPSPYATRPATARSAFSSTLDSDELDDELSDEPSSFRGSKKRGLGEDDDDDDEWVLEGPRKYIKKADREKMERRRDGGHVSDTKKHVPEEKPIKIIMKPSDAGHIRKQKLRIS